MHVLISYAWVHAHILKLIHTFIRTRACMQTSNTNACIHTLKQAYAHTCTHVYEFERKYDHRETMNSCQLIRHTTPSVSGTMPCPTQPTTGTLFTRASKATRLATLCTLCPTSPSRQQRWVWMCIYGCECSSIWLSSLSFLNACMHHSYLKYKCELICKVSLLHFSQTFL